jgi:hypothetical protein
MINLFTLHKKQCSTVSMTRTKKCSTRITVVEVYDENSRNGENFTLIESGTIMSRNDILTNTNLAL